MLVKVGNLLLVLEQPIYYLQGNAILVLQLGS
jgi:hypothetical protein